LGNEPVLCAFLAKCWGHLGQLQGQLLSQLLGQLLGPVLQVLAGSPGAEAGPDRAFSGAGR